MKSMEPSSCLMLQRNILAVRFLMIYVKSMMRDVFDGHFDMHRIDCSGVVPVTVLEFDYATLHKWLQHRFWGTYPQKYGNIAFDSCTSIIIVMVIIIIVIGWWLHHRDRFHHRAKQRQTEYIDLTLNCCLFYEFSIGWVDAILRMCEQCMHVGSIDI